MARWALLLRHELHRYRDLIPEEEDCQDEWEAALDDPEKYVSLLVVQKSDDEQLAESDEENWHKDFDWEKCPRRIIFLRIMR